MSDDYKVWRIQPKGLGHGANPSAFTQMDLRHHPGLKEAAAKLRMGGLVAFPTETVYGLGANALLEDAVQGIFFAKGRPSDNPLIVHIPDVTWLGAVTPDPNLLSVATRRVMEAFWPGPLTILVPAHPDLAPSVHPGLATVGIRVPNHPVAQALIELAGCPVAAPSANKSGRPSPTEARHVEEDFAGEIGGIVDAGWCVVGLESTVVRVDPDALYILRPGAVTAKDLERVSGLRVATGRNAAGAPVEAPGMKYRHYAPKADVHVWWGDDGETVAAMARFLALHPDEKVAVVSRRPLAGAANAWTPSPGESYVVALSRHLYGLLREFDHAHCPLILIQGVPPVDEGAALMNRLEKASGGRVTRV